MALTKTLEQDIVLQQFAVPIIGTAGNDSLLGGDEDDVIVGLQGNDTLQGFAANDLLMGNADIDSLLGAAGNDTISGASGSDFLNGGSDSDSLNGGLDVDTMVGGSGDDRYVVDNIDDVVDEGTNQDSGDTIYSYIDYQLSEAIENLTLLGTENLTGTGNGNTGNNIVGNGGNNILQGRIPVDTAGVNSGDIDTLAGGEGDDTYSVDDSSDTVIEAENEGNDTVESYVSYNLSANVENLSFVGSAPVSGDTITGFGNELNNTFRGNPANNLFLGQGGNDLFYGGSGGVDTYDGSAGNDRYVVYDQALDIVDEPGGAALGVDEVKSYATDYTLTPNIENLILGPTDDQGRAGVNGTGNDLDNFLQGNELNNILNGRNGNDYFVGGLGDDTLNGGADNDTYLFRLNDGADTVNDEQGTLDSVRFGNSIQQDHIAMFFNQQGQLQFGYTDNSTDQVTIENQSLTTTSIERFNLQNGLLMDSGDTQRIFQTMQRYAELNGIAFNSLADVRNNQGLLNIINRGWRGGQQISQSGTINGAILIADIPILPGTLFDDVLFGFNSATYLGLAGNDLLLAGDSIDYLDGGAGNDIMNAGGGNDTVVGGDGNDVLNGGADVDIMRGGNGDDVYLVDRYSLIPFQEQDRDQVIEDSLAGTDTVESFVPYYELPANVENLVLKGESGGLFFGGGDGAFGIGNNLDNLLVGSSKGNYLNGLGGFNTLQGGAGNDIYIVNSIVDFVQEFGTQDNRDTVRANISYALTANVEVLQLQGINGDENINGTGNDLNNTLIGNNGSNVLSGELGNDTLYGLFGNDTLLGGIGDDVYGVRDDDNTTVIENVGQGVDTAQVFGLNYTLTDFVENLVLMNGDPDAPIIDNNGTGNSENNRMDGSLGSNILNGLAGDDTLNGQQGNDTLAGGIDNDTYLFRLNDGADTVVDIEGTLDTIRFSNTIAQDDIIVFRDPTNPDANLQLGYLSNTTDQITVVGQTSAEATIERFELQNGLFMNAEDINKVIAAMTQYASANGVAFDSLQSVRDNADLISIVNGGWHA